MSAAPKLVPKAAPKTRTLKKGEMIFAEGETSRSMYLVKSGIIRIFKKKGEGEIEITSIHSGQILGELAFLDGNPRSASGQALTETELVEISGPAFTGFFLSTPEWFKLLIKTLVGRLRTANTRIRQLETASTAYSEKDGRRTPHYVYLSSPDILKLSSAILLVGTKFQSTASEMGIELNLALLNRYANQVMGVPLAKLTSLLDVYTQIGIIRTVEDGANTQYLLADIEFLEAFIQHVNLENLADEDQRRDLSLRGFLILGLIIKHLEKYPKNAEGLATINAAEIKKLEAEVMKKDPFRLEDFDELTKRGYATPLKILSTDEAIATIKFDEIQKSYRLQRTLMIIQSVNERKKG